MPEIIALEGLPSSGKSTTIGILYDDLMKSNGFSILLDRKRPSSKDFFVIVTKKGKKIGVTTYGDSPKIIKQKIDFFIINRCSIIVIACRPASQGDGTIAMIESYTGFRKQYLLKTKEPNVARHSVGDRDVATNLFNMVESLL